MEEKMALNTNHGAAVNGIGNHKPSITKGELTSKT